MAWVSYGYQQGFAAFWYCALQGIGPLVAAFCLIKIFRAKKYTSLPEFFSDVYQNKIVTLIVTIVVMADCTTWARRSTAPIAAAASARKSCCALRLF